MKKTALLLFVLFCFGSMACHAQYGTQFENRGFESWANYGSSSSTNEPIHWHSGMSADGSFSIFLSQQIEPSTVVRPGTWGSKSVKLWPKSIIGVTANGNLTNGRIHAGSGTAASADNYNYTLRSDERFNTPISSVPDSLTLWVCFRSASSDQNAQAKAFVHGDADFRAAADGTTYPADQLVATASLSFKRTSTAGGSYNWRRLSIPFVNNGPCNDPRYILLNLTTNEVPGQGGTSDDMYIDDVLLIYRPTIQMAALDKDTFRIGESLTLNYTLSGTMSPENLNQPNNQVIAQLSQANGSFSNPTELGRISTNSSGSLNVIIPAGIFEGTHYRIRMVTTNYPMISNDNGTDLSIFGGGTEIAESYDDEEVLLEIYDLTGRRVSEENMAPGIYIARYSTKKGGITVKKILKR